MAEPLEITVQGTPNPTAATCTLNRVVAAQGTTYRDAASSQVGWAQQLLQIPGVEQVFAINNFVSVNKNPEADWNVIGPQAEQILQQAFASSPVG